ncbi:MAG: undecaprenyl-diphosphate phosphatase, partial [Bacteroidia bacterium]
LFQCIAMFPGISRSGATIVGGMTQKLTRRNAAEFSFFLAVPTMFAATAKKLLDFFKEGVQISGHEIGILVFGNVIAFIVALLAIRFFIGFLTKHGFKLFGWYRIAIGALLILLYLLHIPLSIV